MTPDHTEVIRTHLRDARDLLIALRLLLLDFNTPEVSRLSATEAKLLSLDFVRYAGSIRDALNHACMITGYTHGLPARTHLRTTLSEPLTSCLNATSTPSDWLLDLPPRIYTLVHTYHHLLSFPSYTPLPDVPPKPGPLIVARNAHRHLNGLLYHTAHSLARAAATLPDEPLQRCALAYIQEFPPNS